MTDAVDVALPPMPEPQMYPAWDFAGATEVVAYKDAKEFARAYAIQAVMQERERCAKLIENKFAGCAGDFDWHAAAAIRAQPEPKA